MRVISRVAWVTALLVSSVAAAENVKNLPKPTSYVSDFAGVLDSGTKSEMEQLCGEVDHQAHAQIAVVTIHNLGDSSIEDFAADLEQKWGVGKKGTDRGVLMLFAMDDHKDRIEVGYGLEGLLNDAKVGDILRSQRPLMQRGDYSQAIQNDLQQVADDIAADANVKLTAPQHQYHRETERRRSGVPFLRIFFILLVLWLIFRRRGGRGGYGGGYGGGGGFWPGFLIGNLLGGSRGGGGGSGGGWSSGGDSGGSDSGGFGGFDGGSSGGGGASGDW